MLNRATLDDALAIHEACYRLLMWLSAAVDRGLVKFTTAHGYLSEGEAAAEWIVEHFENLPPDCRPSARGGEPLRRFGNYFVSYLAASFDLHEEPGLRRRSVHGGCFCGLCGVLARAPHLKPKKLTPADKKRAQRLKRDYLEELALTSGIQLADTEAAALLSDAKRRADLALGTYGRELLRRCQGFGSSPVALALWRELAWRGGSPKRDFQLTAPAFIEAEGRVLLSLRQGAMSGSKRASGPTSA